MKRTKIEGYSAQIVAPHQLEVLVDRNPLPTFHPKTAKTHSVLGLAILLPLLGRADRDDRITTKLLRCMSLLLAQSGHPQSCSGTSAFGGKADVTVDRSNVRF